ncbi:AzlC family ABC transporter permease [uncultured Finegoldia sp.]|uniref:AzlC family ABC transporter permease n=1 Tax=uncultured Finegoldia sp. TaxID=328009 RepID=UPI0026324EB6|nr:AzlC family ABC transporter permease [uncultured Finegoldia sp.]
MDSNIKEAIKFSSPIMLGYIPVAMAFGLLCKGQDISMLDSTLFSFIFYSGAAQFMAVELLGAGVGMFSIVFSVFLLNLRLFIMSTSLGIHTENINPKALPAIGFMLTDESFSVMSFNRDKLDTKFALAVEFGPFLAWGLFTPIGYLIGQLMPKSVQTSLEVGLTAMFIALVVPSIKKSSNGLVVSLIGVLTYTIIFYLKVIPDGWDIILSILVSSFIGLKVIMKRGQNV